MSKSSVSRTFGGRGVKPPAGVAAAITVIGGTLVVGGQPAAGASFVVTDAGDSGPGTLRQAIDDANASVNDADTITFDPGLAGSTITLTSGTLNISDDLTLTGLGEADLTLTTTDGDILYLTTKRRSCSPTSRSAAGDKMASSPMTQGT